jgi:hypothetical protein
VTRFYKGVGVGTYHHSQDLRITGISPSNPGGGYNPTTVMHHIARGATRVSPCISLTRSYGVAEDYARNASRARPTAENPAHVYEIDIPDPPPPGVLIIDPIYFVVTHNLQYPLASISYHHDGNQDFLIGVVNSEKERPTKVRFPPGMAGTPRYPNLTIELETMVRALRDAEVLAVGNLPSKCVTNRHDIS